MNNSVLNSQLLWNSPKSTGTEIKDSGKFVFNGYNLHDGITKIVNNSDHDDLGTMSFETYNYSRADWGNAIAKYYRTKRITIKMTLKSATEEWLNDLIDELKFATSGLQGNLDIIINWLVRRRQATLIWLKFGRKGHNITFIQNVELSFDCINPFAFNLTSISKTYSWISWNYAIELLYSWKVVCYPTIYVMINSQSWLDNFRIEQNWYLFNIDHELNAWDFLIIDWETKLAKINWTPVEYSWPFPAIEPWLNNIELWINDGALANYDVVYIYKKLYL